MHALAGPHRDFHIMLAELTQNPFFVPVVQTLLRAVPQGLRQHGFISQRGQTEYEIMHAEIALPQAILQAVARKDGVAARQTLDEHMDFGQRLVLDVFVESETSS